MAPYSLIGKRIAYGAGAFVLGCGVAFLLCEALVRIFAPQQPIPRWFEEDAEYRYVLKKNFRQSYPFVGTDFIMEVQTNSLGFRDEEIELDPADKRPRILLLGDSFVFGFGVNIDDRLDSSLQEYIGDEAVVINAGVPAWGTVQETKFGRDLFDRVRPDVIVLTFCGNDPHDDALYLGDRMVFKEKGLFQFPGKQLLRENSHLYRYVLHQTEVLRHNWYLRGRQQSQPAAALDEATAETISSDDWAATLGVIRQFLQDYLAHNPAGLLLVQATHPLNEDIHSHLSTLDNGENLIFVDFSEQFRQLDPEDRRLPFDDHWSPAVHQISASSLYEVLRLKGVCGTG